MKNNCIWNKSNKYLKIPVLVALLIGLALVTQYACSSHYSSWVDQFGSDGEDRAKGIVLDPYGNFYVVGAVDGALPGQIDSGSLDAFVRKYNSDGVELWTRQFGTVNNDWANGISIDESGNIYVVGVINCSTSGIISDSFVRKFAANGVEQWTSFIHSTYYTDASGVATCRSGNVYVTGITNSTLSGQNSAGLIDTFLIKYNSNGLEQWTRQFGTSGYDNVSGIGVDSSENLYIAGVTSGTFTGQNSSGGNDIFICKYNSLGDEQWSRQLGGNGSDAAEDIAIDTVGNLYVAGYTQIPGITVVEKIDTNAFMQKYNSLGIAQWSIDFGTESWDTATGVAVDDIGNFYVCGQTMGSLPGLTTAGKQDSFIRMYDSNRIEKWTRQFGSPENDGTCDIALDNSGNILAVGFAGGQLPDQKCLGNIDAYIIKTIIIDKTVDNQYSESMSNSGR